VSTRLKFLELVATYAQCRQGTFPENFKAQDQQDNGA
jgi:hypothetical protein